MDSFITFCERHPMLTLTLFISLIVGIVLADATVEHLFPQTTPRMDLPFTATMPGDNYMYVISDNKEDVICYVYTGEGISCLKKD